MLELETTVEDRDGGARTALPSRAEQTVERRPAEPVWAVLPDGTQATIREIAAWGTRVSVTARPSVELAEIVTLELRDRQRKLIRIDARVMGLVALDRGYELTLWIINASSEWRGAATKTHALMTPALDSERTAQPTDLLASDRIGPRLRALAAARASVSVRSLTSTGAPPLAARLDPELGLLTAWRGDWDDFRPPFAVQVEGPFSTVQFVEQTLGWDGPPNPKRATVLRRRELRRVSVPSGAKIRLSGLGEGRPDLDLRMQDVSFGGVGAVLDEPAAHLTPGRKIAEVIVTWRGGPVLRFSGEIRHRSTGAQRSKQTVGLRLHNASEAEGERWAREVETLLYPSTRSYRHDYESIWSLLEESGYFDISDANTQSSDFRALRQSFENAYRKIETAPHLGCLSAYESPTRVEATIAGLRIWSRSWFGTQLARSPVRPHIARSDSTPLRDIIFHVFERAGANHELGWIVHYVRDDAPGFSQAVFRDLVLSIPGACGVPFEVWQFSVSMRGDLQAPHVYPANPHQIDDVLDGLRSIRPGPYLEALDLVPETFDQQELRQEWTIHGLFRERTMLVALEGDTIVAAALLEAVEEGLHVYGLLDSVRLFELQPGGQRHFSELLVAANEWFFSMGKSSFVCFDENDDAGMMRSAGGKSLGTAITTCLPRSATPELLERVSEITAPK